MRIRNSLLLGVLAAPLVLAQEGQFRGSITTGYRFTDVKGYEPRFQELFDLNGGLRLLDLNLSGQSRDIFSILVVPARSVRRHLADATTQQFIQR